MLDRIVERERTIEMLPAFHDVPGAGQGNTHGAMPDHERNRRCFFLGERQKLRREVAHHVAVERYKAGDPEAIEDREQQQWIFERLSQSLSLFDQHTGSRRSRLDFWRSVPFDIDERGYERDLQLDLLATQRGSG